MRHRNLKLRVTLRNSAFQKKQRQQKMEEQDYARAARSLNTDIAVIKAVKQVETGQYGAFLPNGKPSILFEGHIFWRELVKRGIDPTEFITGNENILYNKWTKEHYLGGIKEYNRLEQAINIHKEAAYCSASWGMFQIMGFNFAFCMCRNVFEFVEIVSAGESEQLDLFVRFIQSCGLDKHLREHNWKEFARLYNGPGYSVNGYDKRLKEAYKGYVGNWAI